MKGHLQSDQEQAPSDCGSGPPRKKARAADARTAPGDTEHAQASAQVFHHTTSLLDDWLHRGPALADLDPYNSTTDIERVRVGLEVVEDSSCLIFPFDNHYCLVPQGCAQRKRRRLLIPRIV